MILSIQVMLVAFVCNCVPLDCESLSLSLMHVDFIPFFVIHVTPMFSFEWNKVLELEFLFCFCF